MCDFRKYNGMMGTAGGRIMEMVEVGGDAVKLQDKK